jgi:hypothetical protein
MKIPVKYNSNPNLPIGYNHVGRMFECTNEDCKHFNDVDSAVEFWLEATSPITTLDEIVEYGNPSCLETEELIILDQRSIYNAISDEEELLLENF